jgi:hypothetical protein
MNEIFFINVQTDLGTSMLMQSEIDHVITTIPITNQPFNMIHYDPIDKPKYLLSTKNIQQISICLMDNNNNPIDLNGIPFSVIIKLEIVDNATNSIAYSDTDITKPYQKSNLQYIYENPRLIGGASQQEPLSESLLLEYNAIKKMLDENNRSSKSIEHGRKQKQKVKKEGIQKEGAQNEGNKKS